jgi:hypothetical protein
MAQRQGRVNGCHAHPDHPTPPAAALGSGRDPVRDTEDKFEVIRQGDGWVIREFESRKSENAKLKP